MERFTRIRYRHHFLAARPLPLQYNAQRSPGSSRLPHFLATRSIVNSLFPRTTRSNRLHTAYSYNPRIILIRTDKTTFLRLFLVVFSSATVSSAHQSIDQLNTHSFCFLFIHHSPQSHPYHSISLFSFFGLKRNIHSYNRPRVILLLFHFSKLCF